MASTERSWRVRAALRDDASGFFFLVHAADIRAVVELVEHGDMKAQHPFIMSIELMGEGSHVMRR